MSAAAPNPDKIILLAAVGIGVYWFMTKRARAAAVVATPTGTATYPSSSASNAGALAGAVTRALGSLSTLFNPGASTTAQAAGAAVGAANAVSDGNYAGADPSVWAQLSSSAVDGVAANVPNATPFDAGFAYLSGTGGLGD